MNDSKPQFVATIFKIFFEIGQLKIKFILLLCDNVYCKNEAGNLKKSKKTYIFFQLNSYLIFLIKCSLVEKLNDNYNHTITV